MPSNHVSLLHIYLSFCTVTFQDMYSHNSQFFSFNVNCQSQSLITQITININLLLLTYLFTFNKDVQIVYANRRDINMHYSQYFRIREYLTSASTLSKPLLNILREGIVRMKTVYDNLQRKDASSNKAMGLTLTYLVE